MVTGQDSVNPFLEQDEPPSYSMLNPAGKSALVLVCDHASNLVPRRLKGLGLSEEELNTHIAWDPGAAQVAKFLSLKLDAPLVLSGYSRLVIDCNRPLTSPQSIPEHSAGVHVPGNQNLCFAEKEQRIENLFWPYQNAIAHLLQQRKQPTVLISIHSFTPNLNGEHRPWHAGVAYYRDDRLARMLYSALQQVKELVVGFNQPYTIDSEVDYTVPEQGEVRGLLCAMVEIRQDEIDDSIKSANWAQRLAKAWNVSELSLSIHHNLEGKKPL